MNKDEILEEGKLESSYLKENIIDKIKFKRKEVKVGAGIGEDCAAIDFGEYDCIISTDPITASINDIGSLAIHISCNDIASNGVEPVAIVLTVLLPIGTSKKELETIMEDASKAAEEVRVEIAGGHTEITSAVNKPVIVSTAFGRGKSKRYTGSSNMHSGDLILMTKEAGIEGTGIIISDKDKDVEAFLNEEEIEKGKNLLNSVSVLEEGLIGGEVGTHGMHDITEGGVLGAIWEICQVGGKGCLLEEKNIPVNPITKKVCQNYKIDPLRLISSGSMIMIISEDKKSELLEKLFNKGIKGTIIGKITETPDCYINMDKGGVVKIEPPKADELYKVIGK